MSMLEAGSHWTFLTNHAHVLLCLAGSPGMRLRDVATAVGVTERAVQRIVGDLEAGGYLTKHRTGRRNEYQIKSARSLRHPIESHRSIRALIEFVLHPPASGAAPARPRATRRTARSRR